MGVGNEAQSEDKQMVSGQAHGAVTTQSCSLNFIQNVLEILKDYSWVGNMAVLYFPNDFALSQVTDDFHDADITGHSHI